MSELAIDCARRNDTEKKCTDLPDLLRDLHASQKQGLKLAESLPQHSELSTLPGPQAGLHMSGDLQSKLNWLSAGVDLTAHSDKAKAAALTFVADTAERRKGSACEVQRANGQGDSALRDALINQLSPENRKDLDLLRFELSVSNGAKEKESRQSEIKKFLADKLGDKLSDAGAKDILAPVSPADLLAEIKKSRANEVPELLKEARELLVHDAGLVIKKAPALKDFNEKLAAFDARSAARNLPEFERLSTYLQIGRVLNPELKLEHGDKSLLARSMMANAADPTGIDQGSHNTCNVTTLQCRLYTQEPGLASKIVADVACGGQFVTADGTVVKPLSLAPDSEAKYDPPLDGCRNYASQIFQLTAINAYWNRRETMPGGKNVGKGNIQYTQGADGEYLVDASKNPPERQKFNSIESGHPWLDIYGVSEINQQLTGRPSKNFGIERWVYPSNSEGVSKIVTLNGFKSRLSELKNENAFPVIIEVDASKKPFGDGKGFGPHVVTITDWDADKGLVSVDNQWGKSDDMTGLPGQSPKPTAEVLWSSMSQLPSLDFYWSSLKDGLKGVKLKDAVPPAVTSLSTKGMLWGISAAAPLAVRGGLGCLSEWGVPGAASVLSATETKAGSVALRAGTSLAALGAFAYMNDLPGAFKQGASHGTGKLLRITGEFTSFEIGRQLADKGCSAVGLWAPARIGVGVVAGVATSTVFDRVLGESCEVAGSQVYDRVHDYLRPHSQLAQPEKAIKNPIRTAPPAAGCEVTGGSMTSYFANQYENYNGILKGRK